MSTDIVRDLLPTPVANKIVNTGTCWLWTGAKNSKGYGSYTNGRGSSVLAHRHVYNLLVADIPDGMQLDHLCMVTACVNPEHLEPVTNAENAARRAAAQTHCKSGHPLAGDNLVVVNRARGQQRECRTCRARYMRELRARARAEAVSA